MESIDGQLKSARESDERVAPIELILDVAFVLAFSEITAHVVRQQSWLGVLDAVIVLALLWRGWLGFAWLTSIIDPDSAAVRVAVFIAMSAFVVMALIIPSFGSTLLSISRDRPLVYGFVVAHVVTRLVNTFLGLRAIRDDERSRRAVIGTAIGGVLSAALLFWGCATSSPLLSHTLWILAVIADYVFPFIFIRFRWRLVAGRFAERHGLIVIIALGETITAAAVGAQHADLKDPATLPLVVVSVFLLATMWGAYFDGTETAAERSLLRAPAGIAQNTMARQAYSMLHLPLVVGIVLVALGPESAIGHPHQPFDSQIAGAFFGGLALYLLAHVGFQYVTTRRLNVPRLAVGLLMAVLVPFGMVRPAWESVALATSIMAVLVWTQRLRRP